MPPAGVAYVDGYGNLKTTIEESAVTAQPDTAVNVRIGDTELEATASDGSFDVAEGRLAFAPGSSGWPTGESDRTVWMELFLRGGSAWEAFGRPRVGARIEVAP